VPLESSQFVTNIFFSKFINGNQPSCRQWSGTWIAVIGTVVICVFGPNDARCFSIETLESFWFNPVWIAYVIATFAASAVGGRAY